jgi:protein-tyrosine phosphatase
MPNWIEIEGLVNLRDVGGIPTTDGSKISTGVLLRSDNLQTLGPAGVSGLLGLGLTDVIDLRTDVEVASEGPGPLTREDAVTIHHHSLFKDTLTPEETTEEVKQEISARALPWAEKVTPTIQVDDPSASFYLSHLVDRPDSVLASLRALGRAPGATLVHCAAGKDRTGTIVALALRLADADPQAVVDDYAASSDRMHQIVNKLATSDTYRDNVLSRPLSDHLTKAETMQRVLDYIDAEFGSVPRLLGRYGWDSDDTAAIRRKLRAAA